MDKPQETPPPSVPAMAPQGGEVFDRWFWTESAVWTERMLTALEQGVKGGVWFRRIDKVWAEGNLQASYGKVAANGGAPGIDRITVKEFGRDLEANMTKL